MPIAARKMINLNGKQFSPIANADNGRVKSDAIFTYAQTENDFTAIYAGEGFTDGHIIGTFTPEEKHEAHLIYHCRSHDGKLEAGTAIAKFRIDADGLIHITMEWQWLNGNQSAGQSHYKEIRKAIKHDT